MHRGAPKISRLRFSLSCPAYDRTEALRTGEVQPEGLDLVYVTLPPAEAHARMLKNQEFDASDMSMSFYMMSKLSGKESRFTAIPVFPMRRFFHSELLVNIDSGIKTPEDLKGKRIGVQEYGMTLALWLRGILEHEFKVHPSEIEWYLERSPGEKVGDTINFNPPANIRITQVPPNTDLMTMLERGEVDAAFPYPKIWKTQRDRTGVTSYRGSKVVGLFPNPKEESIRFYKKTGFFPINHVIVIKDQILKEYPWVAISLYEAFVRSKEISYDIVRSKLREPSNYVWLDDLVREVEEIFGNDPYPYGLANNRKILEAMASYSYEQRLTPRKATLSDLFFRTTVDL